MGLGRVRRRSSKLFGLACGTAPEQSILATVRRPGRAAPAAQSAGIGTAATQTKVDGSMITAARRPRGQAKFAAPPIVHSLTCSRRIVSQFGDVLVDERKGSFRSVPSRQYRLRHHVVMCWRSPALRRPCCEEAGSSSTVGSSMSGRSLCLWSSASPAGFGLRSAQGHMPWRHIPFYGGLLQGYRRAGVSGLPAAAGPLAQFPVGRLGFRGRFGFRSGQSRADVAVPAGTAGAADGSLCVRKLP